MTCCLLAPGVQRPAIRESQIAAAEDLIDSLPMEEFYSDQVPNPTLQRHYEVGPASQPAWLGLGAACSVWHWAIVLGAMVARH